MASGGSAALRMKMLQFGYNLGFTPIYWDSAKAVLKVSKSKKRLRWIHFQLLLVALYELFLFYQSVRPLGARESTSRVRVRYLAFLWIFMNCDHVGNIWISEYVTFMNNLNHCTKNAGSCKLPSNEIDNRGHSFEHYCPIKFLQFQHTS